MTREAFRQAIIGMTNLASASGLHSAEQALELMFAAVALADKHAKGGCSKEQFLQMAETVYDRLRKSLHGGAQAG